MKLGTDILGSVQSKIMKTLDVIHECFPAELQLHNIFRLVASPFLKPPPPPFFFCAELPLDTTDSRPKAIKKGMKISTTARAVIIPKCSLNMLANPEFLSS